MSFVRVSCWLALLAVAVSEWHLVSAVVAKPITDLFDVSFDASVGGNCAQYGEDRLNNMVSDAFDMATVGLSAVDAATDENNALYGEAVRLLAAWFLSPDLSKAEYDQIGNSYQSVYDFISGSLTAVNGGVSQIKPLLVCGDSWVLRQSMNDQAKSLDSTGNVVELTNNQGQATLMKDIPEYVQLQMAADMTLRQTTYPYWSDRLGSYLFDKKYGAGDDPTNYFCSGNSQGAAQPHAITRSRGAKKNILALCESSFRLNGRRLHTVAPTCADASTFVNSKAPAGVTASPCTAVVPDAGTFFHELFHLVIGSSQTTPANGEEYLPSKMLGKVARTSGSLMTLNEALANPETYKYVATAFDYTLNYDLVNGHPVEWYTGRCTWQD